MTASHPPDGANCRHGVFLALRLPGRSLGLLVTGAAGVGKSELALELIQRGHALVADDAPFFFSRPGSPRLSGACPPVLQGFLELRGLGVLNIHRLFGDDAVLTEHPLDFVLRIVPPAEVRLDEHARLHGAWDEENLLGLPYPRLTLPVQAGRPLALLVETAARVLLDGESGYNAADDLSSRLASISAPTPESDMPPTGKESS
ncbi:MAG: hypothetical protein ACOZAQ_04425 [Pseudomonadota bacterium]